MPLARSFVLSLLLLLPFLATAQPADTVAAAPEDVALGVVWTQPDSLQLALRDLRAMREIGVTAVRTGLVEREPILRLADRLGVTIYQDLPVADLPAARLRDSLQFAERKLTEALTRAQGHPSARAFGLARYADTSDPAACAYFERLAAAVREAQPEARVYYLSRFIEDDQCAGAVDFVLLNARGRDPVGLLRRWRAAHEGTPAGIGSFGVPVNDRVEGGYRTPRSPVAQARALEDALGALLGLEPPPSAIFLRAWREPGYGLIREDYAVRPALDVVRGFYTGRQRIFAFDAGPEPAARPAAPVLVLIGWMIALALAVAAFLAPRFRQLAPRYFVRHPFYREQVQRGRAAETWATVVLAVALAASAGLLVAVVLLAMEQTDVLEMLTAGLNEVGRQRLFGLIETPWAVVLLAGALYGVYLLFNMLWLLALTGRRHRIRAGQALILATWSRWPLLVLLVGALLVATLPEGALRWVPLLLVLWGLVEVWAGGRMLYDFARITRVPKAQAMLVGLGAPLGLFVALLAVGLFAMRPELAFLWNLATKS